MVGSGYDQEIVRIRFHRPSQLRIIFAGQDGSAGLEIVWKSLSQFQTVYAIVADYGPVVQKIFITVG